MSDTPKTDQNEILKKLRQEKPDTVARVQELVKQQNAVRREITKVIKESAQTVPAIAEATGLNPRDVLWHIAAMKKYHQVEEMDMDGEYYTYQAIGRKQA